jgi:hypothetical protein
MPLDNELESTPFDFEKHERNAVVAYLEKQTYYQSLASARSHFVT